MGAVETVETGSDNADVVFVISGTLLFPKENPAKGEFVPIPKMLDAFDSTGFTGVPKLINDLFGSIIDAGVIVPNILMPPVDTGVPSKGIVEAVDFTGVAMTSVGLFKNDVTVLETLDGIEELIIGLLVIPNWKLAVVVVDVTRLVEMLGTDDVGITSGTNGVVSKRNNFIFCYVTISQE